MAALIAVASMAHCCRNERALAVVNVALAPFFARDPSSRKMPVRPTPKLQFGVRVSVVLDNGQQPLRCAFDVFDSRSSPPINFYESQLGGEVAA